MVKSGKVSAHERSASMDALVARLGLAQKRVKTHVHDILAAVRQKFPSLRKVSDDYWTKTKGNGPDVYNWPATREPELVGIAMCDAAIALSDDTFLAELRQRNSREAFSGSLELYLMIERDSYWKFSRWLNVDEKERKEIAIKNQLGRWYLWPKSSSQFIYVVAPRTFVAGAPEAGCLAFIGTFSLRAPQDANAFIEQGQAFYLYSGGEVRERGNWKSEFIGINETQLVIHYRLSYQRRRNPDVGYIGLISLERSREATAIDALDCDGYIAEGTRGYRGEFHTIGPSQSADSGEIYCEELEETVPSEKILRKIFSEAHVPLLKKLKIVT
jgi:hypothetical protein